MKLDREIIIKRVCEFPEPIRELSKQNVVVNTIIHRYAQGDILTREEALAQMVVQLARDWSAMQREACELHMRMALPIASPK